MAFRRAEAGDSIIVRGGTYTEEVGWGLEPGTANAPIVVRNYQSEYVLLKGHLKLEGGDYWTIDGINVTYDPSLGRTESLVKFDGGVGWQFLNAEVWGTRGVSNLMIVGSTANGVPREYRVAGNCIHDNLAVGDPFMNDHNIYLQPGYNSGPGLIERNLIFNAPNGANIKAAGGNPSQSGAANVDIRFNTMANAGAGVIVGYASHDLEMVGNLVGPQVGGGNNYTAAILGNHVTGPANATTNTAVYGYEDNVWSTEDSTSPITEAASVRLDPKYDIMTGCSGFHPTEESATAYGRYGDGNFSSVESGIFRDDDGSVFESDIEKVARAGITIGCNPPTNDLFCPNDPVTRGQMAAFLRRALHLPGSSTDFFRDDGQSTFEADINALALAGITKGCNPPANDSYCPDSLVSRGQMAAFLTRSFNYGPVTKDYFRDDDGNVFERDINSLANKGVTKGCNPPVNDLYCPGATVTRGQMAAFLARALGL
jgi:hypothetical protein